MEETIAVGGLEFVMEFVTYAPREDGDTGPGMLIYGAEDGKRVQLLRFDMYVRGPHYHYGDYSQNMRYNLDPLTLGDGIGWVMGHLRTKFPQLVAKAGHDKLLATINFDAVAAQLLEIERRWRAQSPPDWTSSSSA